MGPPLIQDDERGICPQITQIHTDEPCASAICVNLWDLWEILHVFERGLRPISDTPRGCAAFGLVPDYVPELRLETEADGSPLLLTAPPPVH